MTDDRIPEPDWRYVRELAPVLVERFCARVNAGTAAILADASLSEYDRLWRVYEHVRESDRIRADCFDDWRRSKLRLRLFCMRSQGLFTPDEFGGLTEETRKSVDTLISIPSEHVDRSERRRRRGHR